MTKPNVIFIVSDDHGYADQSHLGIHPNVVTPALDRIAAEGVYFTNAYATAPICSPSRAAIMTGRYQERWGSLWFDSAKFPDEASTPTLAEVLKDAGYRTGYFGKVHYGAEEVGDRACPPHHGFETTLYGLAGHSMGRLHYMQRGADVVAERGNDVAVTMAVQPLLEGDDPVEIEGFLTEILGERSREFVAADDDRPFFCMVAFNAVHNFCWQLPQEELDERGLPVYEDWSPDTGVPYGEWYDDVIVPNLPHGREYYLAQLELMDRQIGAMLDQLDELGLAENTLVVYITDNGGSTCNYGDNTPLRGTKYTLWEGGIRIPMLWRWPGTIPAGEERENPASTLDLMATFRSLAGSSDHSPVDGEDLLPVMLQSLSIERTLHWECGFQFATREGDWKLTWTDPDDSQVAHLKAYEQAPMGSGWHLSNLRSDIGESRNEFDNEPAVARRLLRIHDAWAKEMGLDLDRSFDLLPDADHN
ncbi:MAG: sulfatase family protein [Arachnia sp.]